MRIRTKYNYSDLYDEYNNGIENNQPTSDEKSSYSSNNESNSLENNTNFNDTSNYDSNVPISITTIPILPIILGSAILLMILNEK